MHNLLFTAKYSMACTISPTISITRTNNKRSNLTTPEDSQPMISYRTVSYPKPLGPIISKLLAFLSLAILV